MPYSMGKGHGCSGGKPWAVYKTESGEKVACHESEAAARKHLAALKMNVEDAMLEQIGDKLYATARAFVVEKPEDMPREMAAEFDRKDLNPGFVWIAGRYVQANNANRNGHYWTLDDLQKGEQSIRFTPMNVLHDWERPVGTLVETKIVHREDRLEGTDRLLPEIQALGVLWEFNFPEIAQEVRKAHDLKQLWYSMECVAEAKQCLVCEQVFPFRAQAHEVCEHMAGSPVSPRRFINPVFMGGALIFAPQRPAWPDADVTEVAHELVRQFAVRESDGISVGEWEHLMGKVLQSKLFV